MTSPAALRWYAETPDRFSHVAAGGSVERAADERICILQGATWASLSALYTRLRALAVARGTPALVTHAVPETSYPILRRLGFSEVCVLRRLEDS